MTKLTPRSHHSVKSSGLPLKPEYPQIHVKLTPAMTEDQILGTMGNTLRAANFTQDDIHIFYDAARRGKGDKSRAHLIAVCKRWVTVTGV